MAAAVASVPRRSAPAPAPEPQVSEFLRHAAAKASPDGKGPSLAVALRIAAVEQDVREALADLVEAMDAAASPAVAKALGRLADAGEAARNLQRKVGG